MPVCMSPYGCADLHALRAYDMIIVLVIVGCCGNDMNAVIRSLTTFIRQAVHH